VTSAGVAGYGGGMPTRRVQAGGIELAVAEEGAGGRPFLLLHGFTGAKEDFALPLEIDGTGPSALRRLADAGWHAVAPDQRGHGDSGQPEDDGAYTIESYAADAIALADALGWDRFALLGHSMGGMIAQAVALTAPARVHALVLMDTGPGPLRGVDRAQADLAATIAKEEGMPRLAALMAERRGQSPLETPASLRLLRERPGWPEFGDRKVAACSPAMYAAMMRVIFEQEDRLPALAGLPMPTLVVVGEQDTPFLAPARRMADTIPGARLEVIPDAGHSPQFEHPAAWWKALEHFAAEVPA
jgi:3-oxoadipate enol-lactonase